MPSSSTRWNERKLVSFVAVVIPAHQLPMMSTTGDPSSHARHSDSGDDLDDNNKYDEFGCHCQAKSMSSRVEGKRRWKRFKRTSELKKPTQTHPIRTNTFAGMHPGPQPQSKPPEGSFVVAPGETQEIISRGILRIQPAAVMHTY